MDGEGLLSSAGVLTGASWSPSKQYICLIHLSRVTSLLIDTVDLKHVSVMHPGEIQTGFTSLHHTLTPDMGKGSGLHSTALRKEWEVRL